MTCLVIGATGNVGGELVTQLLEQGQQVRALVREASRAGRLPAGTGIAVGDLDDAESLTAAARGVEGVFYMQLAPLPAQAGYMVQAAKAAGVSKIVLLSSLGTVGRPVEFVPVTPAEFACHSVEHGTPPEMAGAVQNLNELFRAGRAGVLTDDITNLTGTAPRAFRDWAEHHADAFK